MELNEILDNIGLSDLLRESYQQPREEKHECKCSKKSDEKLAEENRQLKDGAQKLLNDFDRVNTDLRDILAENEELKERIKNLQSSQVEQGKTVRQNAALSKAFGEILGAIEKAKKDM